ncbi:MAG: hypothetical protein AB7J28_13295 [Hyphomonadaceae bacterium]
MSKSVAAATAADMYRAGRPIVPATVSGPGGRAGARLVNDPYTDNFRQG